MKLNNKKIALIVAVVTAGAFLWFSLRTPNGFNFIPLFIHEAVDSGGSSEAMFILLFDVFVSFIILGLSYKLLMKLLADE